MLGNALREVSGPWKDHIEKLMGPEGEMWLAAWKRFLRKENPWQALSKNKAVGFAESVRAIQTQHLRAKGYAFDKKDIPLPDEAKLKLGPALLIDYQTPVGSQCQLLGIRNYLVDFNRHMDQHPKPQGRWGWIYGVENGKKMLGRLPNQAIEEFKKNNRRGLMTVEGFALIRENPKLLKDHYIDLSGSRYDKFCDNVPGLYLSEGQPELHNYWADESDSDWGSASAVVV